MKRLTKRILKMLDDGGWRIELIRSNSGHRDHNSDRLKRIRRMVDKKVRNFIKSDTRKEIESELNK